MGAFLVIPKAAGKGKKLHPSHLTKVKRDWKRTGYRHNGGRKTVYNSLRREWIRVPRWRRTKRAVDAIRAFVIRFAKAKEVRIGKWLNLEMWQKRENPPSRVEVKITKDKDIARVELSKLPPRAVREAEKLKTKEAKKKKLDASKQPRKRRKERGRVQKEKRRRAEKLEDAKHAKVTKEQEMSMRQVSKWLKKKIFEIKF